MKNEDMFKKIKMIEKMSEARPKIEKSNKLAKIEGKQKVYKKSYKK
jgi:hypothetical protein